MGQDTYGDYDDGGHYDRARYEGGQPDDRGQPEAYWRRRVITLCAGLALLGLLAWAFSGGGGKAPGKAATSSQATGVLPAAAYSGSPTAPAAGTSAAASAASAASAGSAATLPFPATTSSRGGGSGGSAQPSATASGGKAAHAAANGAGPSKAQGNGSGVEPNGSCAPGSVVLSLFTSRTDYYAGEYPSFQVDAVSTASRTCSFDISPRRLHVEVMSSGRVIWDSADCSRGEPDRSVALRRGVPTEASATWRRVISLPGCVTVASSARTGTYEVQAKDASVASPVRSFRLVR
jgi:hypothetical protein